MTAELLAEHRGLHRAEADASARAGTSIPSQP